MAPYCDIIILRGDSMKNINISEISQYIIENIGKGFFLNSSDGNIDNTMIIGWGGPLIMHSVDAFVVAVRPSRFTYELLNKNPYFTISIPLHDMKEQIKIAGSKSGRDIHKFGTEGLTAEKAKSVNVPIVKECGLHIECKIISYADMQDESIEDRTRKLYYADGDLHRFYIGKILEVYYTDR